MHGGLTRKPDSSPFPGPSTALTVSQGPTGATLLCGTTLPCSQAPQEGGGGVLWPGQDMALECPWGSGLELLPGPCARKAPRAWRGGKGRAQPALHALSLGVFDAILTLGPVPVARVTLFSKQLWPKRRT